MKDDYETLHVRLRREDYDRLLEAAEKQFDGAMSTRTAFARWALNRVAREVLGEKTVKKARPA